MPYRIFIFLLINFGALGLGSYFTSSGVGSEWYAQLNKAPWTPPGWVFGVAWTTIMLCFSIYMANLWPEFESKNLIISLFGLQWILNVIWNPIFFKFNAIFPALIVISILSILIGYILISNWQTLKTKSILLLPYLLWLLIATSLNAYIWIKN